MTIGDALKKVPDMTVFKKVISDVFSFYSNSPKMKNELFDIAADRFENVKLREFSKVFEIRWAFSSKVATDSFLNNLGPLVSHLEKRVHIMKLKIRKMKKESVTKKKLLKKYSKLKCCLQHITSFPFIAQLCLLNDCLTELTFLSLLLQKETVPTWALWPRVISTKKVISEYGYISVNEEGDLYGNNGPLISILFDEIESQQNVNKSTFIFKSTNICKPTKNQLEEFFDTRKLFTSTLVEQLSKRFGGPAKHILQLAEIFDPNNWTKPHGVMESYGGYEIRSLAMFFGFDINQCSLLSSNFRNMKKGLGISRCLQDLIAKVETLPFTTSECERGQFINVHYI